MTMLILFVYDYNRNKRNAKFYLPSTFQTSDIEVLGKNWNSPTPHRFCLYGQMSSHTEFQLQIMF